MNRVETKYLFSEGVSPNIKRIVLMKRSGLVLTEREQRDLKRFNETVSITKPIPHDQRQVKLPISKTHDIEFDVNLDDEIDLEEIIQELEVEMMLDEILKEMGYLG
jgi:hypothetical protein